MKKITIIILGIVVVGVAYYLISPLFINVTLDESLPESNEIFTNPEDVLTDEIETQVVVSTEPSPVSGTSGHPASGTVRVINVDGKNYLRYEDFKTINGPDIFVYLSKDLDAKDYVNLGRVKATEGNINYEVPDDVDPKEYPYALVWCKAFGVLFNSAKLY